MNPQTIEEVKSIVKNWWMSLVLGILLIGLGLLLMFIDLMQNYAAISIVFSALLFVSGIFEIVFSIINRKMLPGWGWYLSGSIIDLVLGFFLVCYPVMSMAVSPYVLACWLMYRGISGISYSVDLKRFGVKSWIWLLTISVLSIICSLVIICQPLIGAFSIVYMLIFALLFMGIFRIMLAFKWRGLYEHSQKLKKAKSHLFCEDEK